jgi:hypothetical protein
LDAAWPEVLAEINRVAPRLAASLKGSRIQSSNGAIRILTDPNQKPEILSDPKARRVLEQAVQRRFGTGLSVETVPAEPGAPAPAATPVPRATEASPAGPAPAGTAGKPAARKAPEIDATARDWLESFNGSIQ